MRWTESPEQDLTTDDRGWVKGLQRRWDGQTLRQVERLYAQLLADPHEFFAGATAIQQAYRRRYPNSPVPPLRTLGRMLKALGLSAPRRRGRNKGAARYLCYPEQTVYGLGQRVLEADFIGHKYLTGRTAPVNFLGFGFRQPPKLRYFQRVAGETAEALLAACRHFFRSFEVPDVIKVDNGPATVGSGSAQRTLSRFMQFLLQRRIVPVFAVPKKPFSQASIEGNNSVFSRKFWRSQIFTSLRQVDQHLRWFNTASERYSGYVRPKRRRRCAAFVPRVHFIRQVREHSEPTAPAGIDVLNEWVALPTEYTNYFVLAEWNLTTEELYIHFERDGVARCIKTIPFPINPNSQYKLN